MEVKITREKIIIELKGFNDFLRLHDELAGFLCFQRSDNEFIYFSFDSDYIYLVKTDIKPETCFVKYHVLEDNWQFVKDVQAERQTLIFRVMMVKAISDESNLLGS